MTTKPATLRASPDLLVCVACGTQYDTTLDTTSAPESTFISGVDPSCPMKTCRMCDDPRQFVPAPGHRFTSLQRLWDSEEYSNVFETVKEDENVIEVWTEPKFGIGQRACIIKTPHGNVMWDCIAYLDEATVQKINSIGGLDHIIISHPHFYTTWPDWVSTFSCQLHLSTADQQWLNRPALSSTNLISSSASILPGLTAIVAGGHFPGSMLLHSLPPNTKNASLFLADTIMTVPSGMNPNPDYNPDNDKNNENNTPNIYYTPPSGTTSYSFMWSIPNMIPLNPAEILNMWNCVKDLDFRMTYGVMTKSIIVGRDSSTSGVSGGDVSVEMTLRERVLRSMQIFCKRMGYNEENCEVLRVRA